MVRPVRTLLIGLLIFAGTALARPAEGAVSVRVDRDEIRLDETFALVFEIDTTSRAEPDFSALERDFEILSSQQRSNYGVINGRVNASTTWELEVLARRSGTIELPPIAIGDEQSPPLTLIVSPGSPDPVDEPGPLLLELDLAANKVYVQAELVCTLRMYFDLRSAERRVSDLVVSGVEAVVRQLGEDERHFTTRDGRRYELIERRYGIYPQASGRLTLDPVTLQARLIDRGRMLSRAGPLRRIRSEPRTIEVLPIPDGYPGADWLPARSIELEARAVSGARARVGEPVTVVTELTADGLNPSQLPAPELVLPQGLKAYFEPPELTETSEASGVQATRRGSMALIANQPGEYRLPAISLPWWNTALDRLEYARSKPITLSFEPVATTAARPAAPSPSAEEMLTPSPITRNGWIWATALLALGWLGTALLWYRDRRGRRAVQPQAPTESAPSLRALQRALRARDARSARRALVAWCAERWPASPGLTTLRSRASRELLAELDALDAAVYSATPGPWRGARLAVLIGEADAENPDKGRQPVGLPPLYPSENQTVTAES